MKTKIIGIVTKIAEIMFWVSGIATHIFVGLPLLILTCLLDIDYNDAYISVFRKMYTSIKEEYDIDLKEELF